MRLLGALCVGCALLLLAGCGGIALRGASAPGPSRAALGLLPPSKTCPAVRAALPAAKSAPATAMTPTPAPATPATVGHLSYSRVVLGPLPLQLVYRPGATVRFTWCALPDPSQVTAKPLAETLTAGFIGPYATRAAAVADLRPAPPPNELVPRGPYAASTSPIQTTTWDGTDATAPLTLPAHMAAGYYLFFALDDVSVHDCVNLVGSGCRGGGSNGGVVQITPV